MKIITFIKNAYLRISNIVFLKIFIVFVIAISIPAISISMLLIKYSADNIVKQVSISTNNLLAERTRDIDKKFVEIDNMIMQYIFNDNILSISGNYDEKYDKYLTLNDVRILFQRNVTANKLVDSIYYYDDIHSFVLTNTTMYSKDDFNDNGIFKVDFEGNRYSVYRELKGELNQNKYVVSYFKKFNYLSNNNTIHFIVNLKPMELINNILPDDPAFPMEVLIFDDKNNIIFSNSKTIGVLNFSILDMISKIDENKQVIKIDDKDFFVSKTHSNILNWTVAYLQSYSELVQATDMMRRLIIPLLVVVLMISFILAYIFSVYLYKPLGKLITEVVKYSGTSVTRKDNGYDVIDNALKNLFTRNNELLSKYQLTFPYLQQYFVYGIMKNDLFDMENFKSALKLMDVNMQHSTYITVLIDFENVKYSNEIKEYMESHFLNSNNSDFVTLLSNISDTRVVLIVNTEKSMQEVHSIFVELKEGFNKNGVELTMSVGKPYNSLDGISLSVKEVLKQMNNKFFTGKNEIIYNSNYYDYNLVDGKLYFSKKLEEELLCHIKSQNSEKAVQVLGKITENIVENAGSIEYIKYVYYQISMLIIYSLNDIGIDTQENEMSGLYIFEFIQKSETLQALQDFICALISRCIYLIEDLKKRQHTIFVDKIIEYIKMNYYRDISLDEISKSVFLSPRHISGIFKAETGQTILDYITKLRMEIAKDLILNGNEKIQDVAKTVGYNNIQTFLRLFRKSYGMSPVQYRRKSC